MSRTTVYLTRTRRWALAIYWALDAFPRLARIAYRLGVLSFISEHGIYQVPVQQARE